MAAPLNQDTESNIIINGYLEKQSLHLKQYRKRWIVLKKNGCLHAFKTKEEFDQNNGQETEIIDLNEFNYILTSENTNKFAFIPKGKNSKIRKREFKTSNIQMKNKWIKYIKLQQTHLLQSQNENDLIQINIAINNDGFGNQQFKTNFFIHSLYSHHQRIKNIFNPIIKYLTDTFHPLSLKIDYVKSESFTGYIVGSELNNMTVADKRLTDYDKNDIVNHGIDAVVVIHRQHTIKSQPISCVHMNEIKSSNPMDCPIYYAMKENCDFTAEHLAHLHEFTHFLDEYNEKTICQYKDNCAAFIRLENGRNGLSDQCHIKLYLHPARKRYTKLWQNANSLIFDTKARRNHVLYMPVAGSNSADYDEWDGYLHVLIEEVIVNGYQYDLCLQCAVNEREECKHNIYDDTYSILTMVNDKMECHRHKSIGKPLRRDHMLSLILYTNCECSYDLCGSQRKGDYGKWKWFDYCLWNAIDELSRRESGSFTVYSAINRVKLDRKSVECGYFATYVSSSWNKAVADRFLINGMIIEMDEEFKNNAFVRCADVSWISKFADEFEVLFARSLDCNSMKFKCVVLNESHGVQTVSLKR